MRGFYFYSRDMEDKRRYLDSGILETSDEYPKGINDSYLSITIKVPKRCIKGIDINSIVRWTPVEIVLPHELGGNAEIPRVQLLRTILEYEESRLQEIREKLQDALDLVGK